jgi:dynein heavy chain 1
MLNLNVSLQELTFGMLWDSGVLKQKKGIMEILSMAQGEMALEVFLSQVRDRWMKQELDLAVYRNRTRLIKGWDILYTALDEHMGGLALMKNSPYLHSVREFQEESKVWEDRLTKLRGLFDLLMNVQRRYVYLEGIFIETSDIKARLPTEWARFRSVDGEFISLMRRITSQPYALEMLNVENIDRILDRLDTTMNSTQRALGDYLSAQRNDFSRFFFLGDDDLLEILGNSVRTSTSVSHIGKMFAGLGSIKSKMEITVGGSVEYIDTMISKDGEEVTLHDTIMVSKSTSCLEWLRQLEEEMYTTLRNLLKIAVKDVTMTGLDLHHIDGQEAVDLSIPEWINKYPNQIMMLAILINWSSSVSDSLGKSDCKARLNDLLQSINRSLERLSVHTMQNLTMVVRKKIEQLITELVYERDILLGLIAQGVQKADDFRWLSRLRFKYSEETDIEKEHLRISLSHATFSYGFEYLGIGERLVQTPLTDRCYLTLTQALHHRLGGNPFGPVRLFQTNTNYLYLLSYFLC